MGIFHGCSSNTSLILARLTFQTNDSIMLRLKKLWNLRDLILNKEKLSWLGVVTVMQEKSLYKVPAV